MDTPTPARKPQQEPQTEYERMLDRNGLDCCIHGCWEPMRAFVTEHDGKFPYCERHAKMVVGMVAIERLES